ncbi:MAG: PAS domain S-box protein [Cyclobacteriaceae bacterium]|nr:PAS domain S-box protein [Cyclobacteriaceae bacterium]
MEKISSTNSTYFKLFALGFAVILLAIIVIQIILQQSINHTVDPALINKSGRQRMISQRVSKLCLYLEHGISPTAIPNFNPVDSLRKYSNLLQSVHTELINKNKETIKNKEIETLLDTCSPLVQIISSGSKELITLSNSSKNDLIILTIAEAEMKFLPTMEKVTKAFELESIKELDDVKSLERKLSIALGVIIIALFLILYFPILKKIEDQNELLIAINQRVEQARSELLEERILLRTIIDNVPINIYVKDKESRKTLANKSEWMYVGAQCEDEVLGKSDHDVYPWASAEISFSEDQEVLNGSKIIGKETFSFKKDGTETWFLTSKVPLQKSSGEIFGLVGVSMDITDRKLISLELQKSLEEARELYDHAPCGYHSISSDGTIQRMNQTELNWLGYTHEEVVGKMNVNQILTEKSRKERILTIEQLLLSGSMEDIDAEFLRKDGSIMNVILNTHAEFNAEGKMIGNRSTVFDSTERKKLETELKEANERLIQLNEEKNSFMAMATHDLKNPLNSISGLINLIRHDKSISRENQKLIGMINSTTMRMRDLISRLLDYSKIEQGKTQVNNRPVNLAELIQARLTAFEPEAIKKEIELKFQSEGVSSIHSDPDVLAQIFDNLISNAIKFSKSNTLVVINVFKVGKHVIIEVIDQGQGIPPDEVPKLFLPFTRLSVKPTAHESSSGLGLSIVKQLVQFLGGAIRVESTVGKGSTFRVALKHE